MTLGSRHLAIALAAAGSGALLLGALAFQHFGGLPPCKLCIFQRWPHLAAVVIGALALATSPRRAPPAAWAWLGAVAVLASGAIGAYHAGIEYGLWPGPDSCTGTGAGLKGLSGKDLLDFSRDTNVVMCDEIQWSLAGLSMAGWNVVICVALAGLWLWGGTRRA